MDVSFSLACEFSGFLEALAQGGKNWKKKYFVLRDNFLLYFKEVTSKKPEGVIPLEGAIVEVADKYEKCFEVTTGTRRYHLRIPLEIKDSSIDDWIGKVKSAAVLTIDTLYETLELLGQGTFSKVKRAIEKSTGKEFAIKIIDKTDLSDNRENILTEIGILKNVSHPHIIRLHHIFESKKKIYLVTELLEGGELFDRIVEKGSFSEADASALMRSIVEAIQYLHSKGIVHRDLKPENLLFDTADESAKIKITDFGLSKFSNGLNSPESGPSDDKKMQMYQTACGTPGYVAPEVLELKGYDKSVDMWSIGVILYILLCGFPPFYADSDAELYEQIKSCEFAFPSPYWDDISSSVKELIGSLLQRDPTKRATPEQVLEHPWIQGRGVPTQDIGSNVQNLKASKRLQKAVLKIKAANRFYKNVSSSDSIQCSNDDIVSVTNDLEESSLSEQTPLYNN